MDMHLAEGYYLGGAPEAGYAVIAIEKGKESCQLSAVRGH
jgi:hypothetical protein